MSSAEQTTPDAPEFAPIWRRTVRSWEFLAAVAILVAARAFAYWGGIRMEERTPCMTWQLLDLTQLRTNLLESIWYLHGQPPLFNLSVGILVKLFGDHAIVAAQIMQHAFGFGIFLGMALLPQFLGVPRRVALAVATFFSISPATVFVEYWWFYTYPVVLFLVAVAVMLFVALRDGKPWQWLVFFGLIAAVTMTRSVFHLVFIFVALAGVWWVRRSDCKKLLATAAVPLLIVCGWYAKNQVLYGHFAASTWQGLSIAKIFHETYPPNLIRREVGTGEIPQVWTMHPFFKPDRFEGIVERPEPTRVAILDEDYKECGDTNYHTLYFLRISEAYEGGAGTLIRKYPAVYLKGRVRALLYMFRPTTDYFQFVDPIEKAPRYTRAFDLLHGRLWPQDTEGDFKRIAWFLPLVYLIAFLYGAVQFWRVLRRPRGAPDGAVLAAWLWGTVLYISLVTLLFDHGENARFRYLCDPYTFVLALAALHAVCGKILTKSKEANRMGKMLTEADSSLRIGLPRPRFWSRPV